jgi:periplasmic copper chaperone A
MRPSRSATLAAVTAALLVGSALPASAHPFFTDGATAPAGSLTTLTLAMAHGCGTETDAGGDPTTEVAVEVPEQVSYLEPGEVDGYEVEVEGDEGQVPEVVLWTATDGGEPAPELTMDLVVEGEPGDEIHVRVFQGCDDFEYRWIGTPDEPAEDPAVRLTLGEPDPDAPPPPEPTEAVEPEDEATEADDEAAEVDDSAADEEAEEEADDQATAVEDLPTEPPEDEAEGLGWWPFVLGAIVLAGVGGLLGTLLARRRPVRDPSVVAPGEDPTPPGQA